MLFVAPALSLTAPLYVCRCTSAGSAPVIRSGLEGLCEVFMCFDLQFLILPTVLSPQSHSRLRLWGSLYLSASCSSPV